VSCRSSLGAGIESFSLSRYPEAIAELRQGEREFREGNVEERARYALYRGLTHLALGDARAAESWLRFARVHVSRNAQLLKPHERGQLSAAWRSLGYMQGDG